MGSVSTTAAVILAALVIVGAGFFVCEFAGDSYDDGEREPSAVSAGSYLKFSLEGSSNPGIMESTTINGYMTYRYIAYNGLRDAYLVEQDVSYTRTVTYGFGLFSNSVSDDYSKTSTYWTDENDDHEWSVERTGHMSTVDGMVKVDIYSTSYWNDAGRYVTEKQYISAENDWIVYLIQYSELGGRFGFGGTTVTYTLSEHGTDAEVPSESSVTVYAERGIAVSGGGVYGTGETVSLTASPAPGYGFGGWFDYDTQDLLSSETEYSFEAAGYDVKIYAVNTVNDYRAEAGEGIDLTSGAADGTWTIIGSDAENVVDTVEGANPQYVFSDAGTYRLFFDGTDAGGSAVHMCGDAFVDGTVARTYRWTYDDADYEYTLRIGYSDYLYFKNDAMDPKDRCDTYRKTGDPSHDVGFVITEAAQDDAYLAALATEMKRIAAEKSMNDQETANLVLAFTQYVEYKYDDDSTGYEEYFKYPLETLYQQNGDCEDTAILFCAIMREMGYDTALFLMKGHMASGVLLDDFDAPAYNKRFNVARGEYGWTPSGYAGGGDIYYYCETTAAGWLVGQMPSSVAKSLLAVMVVGTDRTG